MNVDRESEVARAVEIIAEQLLAAHRVGDRAVIYDGDHFIPCGAVAVVHFLEVFEHVPLALVAAKRARKERGVRPLGQVIEPPVEPINEQVRINATAVGVPEIVQQIAHVLVAHVSRLVVIPALLAVLHVAIGDGH